MRPHAIENASALLILIESVVKETAQKAAALRDSKTDRAFDVIVLVGQKRFHAGMFHE
jgi:hypothetical protein